VYHKINVLQTTLAQRCRADPALINIVQIKELESSNIVTRQNSAAFSVVRWYLFLEKKPGSDIGHNPVAQAAMFGYFLLSVFMILTGFALFGEHSQYAIFAPFRYVVEFFYWTGGNSIDIHSWHRLGMWLIAAFIVGHVYLAIREDIMSDDTVISTMINGYRSHKFPKPHDKEPS
ncbi:Ni/Fe-hydrogenase, b-type cytochrome subunit, partial [Salmonella enterica subsp. enterica serovar Montevideo]|nr:Ni/Fe-hydrogenase, b-type cytochrome subunit [Salmonella enterica subsp. enterica serovar Montevideo]